MQQCPNCGHQNRPGVVFCDNCAANLLGVSVSTKSLDPSRPNGLPGHVDSSILLDVKVEGTDRFEPGDTLRLEVEGSTDAILLTPKPETIFGRRDPATGAMPDIDLTPFAGYRMGVSRRHAALRHGDEHTLDLWDLGSSNGTFLNGQRLSAHRPYRLRDGDEIRLGQMVIRVHFDPKRKPAAPSTPSHATSQSAQPPSEPHAPGSQAAPPQRRPQTGTLLRPPSGPRPVDSMPKTGALRPPNTQDLAHHRPSASTMPGNNRPAHRPDAPRTNEKRD